jgi:predicted protein tyrosine phosphatase
MEQKYFSKVSIQCDMEKMELTRMKYAVRRESDEQRKAQILKRIKSFSQENCKLLDVLRQQLGYN